MGHIDTTVYKDIADEIREKIYLNIYKPNEMLPSEKEFFEKYQVSRRTVRRAINLLVSEGLLCTVPGKGIFVRDKTRNIYKVDIELRDLLSQGYDDARLVYANMSKPDIYDVYNLQIHPDEHVIVIKWRIVRNNSPIAYDIKTIPYLSGIPIGDRDLGHSSLYDILSSKYLLNELTHKARIESCIPNAEVINVLKLDKESLPIIKVEIALKTFDDKVCGFNTIYIKADEFRMKGSLI